MSTPTTTLLTLTRSRFSVLEWCSAVENACLSHGTVRRAVKMALDFGCAALSIILAVAASEGFAAAWTGEVLAVATAAGLVLVAAHAVWGSYRAIWRYASLREVIPVAVAALVVTAGLEAGRMAGVVPLSGGSVLLGVLLMLFSCVALRALRRWQMAATKRSRRERWAATPGHAPRGVLIVGAGEHGLSIGRELVERRNGVALAGYLDDDVGKIGAVLNGARVLGPLKDVLTVCETHRITEVIVAMPSADPLFVRGFLRRLEDTGIRARAVEGVHRFVTGEELHRPGTVKLHELLDSGPAAGRDRPGTADDPAVRRVLVTGGAGFIGSHLTRMLLDRGYHVRLLDRFDYGRAGIEGLRHPNLQIIQGDICNSRDVSRAVKNVDGVIALAAIVGDPACNLDPEETINLNYTATKILAETCNLYGVRRLVFASSCSVYGASGQDMLTEESRLNPVSLYARTRVLSENILFDRHGDVEPVVVRLATVFGLSPRMRFDLVVNTLTVRAVTEQRITIFGGNQWRPNVHCRDAARAFILALEAPAALVAGQIFNLGGDKLNHRISELGELVAPIVGGGTTVEISGDVADPRDYRVSFAKIRRVLGFEPLYTVADGVREVVAAVRAHPALRHWRDPIYHNVQALKETFVAPRRRRDDRLPARALVQA
jgi:nucleoside-diphosphate-sugar epimerase